MDGMEACLGELNKMKEEMVAVDQKLGQQGTWIDEMQMKVNMSMELIGKVQQEHHTVVKSLRVPYCW